MDQREEKYFDQETGHSFTDARSMIDAYLARFSEKVSTAAGTEIRFSPLDEQGYTSVTRGSATVGINVIEEQGFLMFLCRIMPVPQDPAACYRRLLELNYLATSDGAFAVDRETETIFLRAMRALGGLDYDEFEDMLHSVATVADEWDDILINEFGKD